VSLQELVPQLPPEFVSLVEGMLERDRAQRIPDLRQPFEQLRAWSGSSARGFSHAVSIRPPLPSSLPFEATEQVARAAATPHSAPVVSAAHGLGASAVPVTRGVSTARKGGLAPLLIGGGVLGALGAAAMIAAVLGEPAESAASAAGSAGLASSLALSSATVTPPPSAETVAAASAAVESLPAVSASAAASGSAASRKPRVGNAKSSTPRKLLPGGVDQSVPF
jgi:hypothetical protein